MKVKQEFFIEQPISIEATGDYHAFGAFVTEVAALPRIVTLHDFVVEAGKADSLKASDIPVVNYSIKAKTYRYISPEEQVERIYDSTSYNDNSSSSRRAALMNNYKNNICSIY